MEVPEIDQMTEDMAKHFNKRLHALIVDTVHTCEIGGVGARETVAVMLANLIKEVVCCAGAMDIDEEEFMALMCESYRHMLKGTGTMKQWKKEQKR